MCITDGNKLHICLLDDLLSLSLSCFTTSCFSIIYMYMYSFPSPSLSLIICTCTFIIFSNKVSPIITCTNSLTDISSFISACKENTE